MNAVEMVAAPTPRRRIFRWLGGGVVLILGIALIWAGWVYYHAINPPLSRPLAELGDIRIGTLAVVQPDAPQEVIAFRPLRAMVRPGVPTLIGFWASWCAPCREEARVLARLRGRLPEARANMIYLNIDQPEQFAVARAFLAETGAQTLGFHPVGQGVLTQVSGQAVAALPRTYMFDAQGMPVDVLTGFLPGQTDAELAAWAEGKPVKDGSAAR